MTGGGYRLLASANFGELVLGCIEAKFCSFLSNLLSNEYFQFGLDTAENEPCEVCPLRVQIAQVKMRGM